MLTLRSHTHLQATQAKAPTKAYKRVCLPNRTDTPKLDGLATTAKEGRRHNSTYKKLAVQCSADPPRRMVNQTLVLRINPPWRMVKIANFL